MEEEDEFDFDIPGITSEELKLAKRIALKDIRNEFQANISDNGSFTTGSPKVRKPVKKLDKK